VKVARDMCAAMRNGVSRSDCERVLFDGPGRPSLLQVRGYIDAALRYLAPDVDGTGAPMFVPPVGFREVASRALSQGRR